VSRRAVVTTGLGGALLPGVLKALVGGMEVSRSATPVDQRNASIVVKRVAYATVWTTSGAVRGQSDGSIFSFKGIPYGASTDASRRFLPPQRPTPWTNIRDALEFGPIAPQENPWERARKFTRGGYAGTIPLEANPISEDCLCLNVWTPMPNSNARRPVMLWIHGGSFIGGSSSADWYDGTNLSRRGNVVVVSVNHRLGTPGFLYVEKYGGAEFATSGLSGMLDLVAALEWVRDNVDAFGGDPGCVTIFGESGGGWKVSTLLAMPSARGLFHRAVIESGAGVRVHTKDQGQEVTELLLQELGLRSPGIGELQDLGIDRVIAAQQRLVSRVRGGELPGIAYEYQPVIDGVALARHPFDPDAPDVSGDVPVLIGTNRTEAAWGLWRDPEMEAPDMAVLRQRLATSLHRSPDGAIDLYRRLHPDLSLRDLYVLIMSSPHESIRLAERKATKGRAPVFMYRFDWETPVLGAKLKTPHMLEVPFVFNNVDIARRYTGGGPRARALAETICDAWVQFARTGSPQGRALPRWPAYTLQDRATMLLNDHCEVVSDPDREARLFWSTLS
jgi:para-nitrobenzyl esterase